MTVHIAAKVDPEGMDTKNVRLYATNSYIRIVTYYWIDSNGYIRFSTELAGDIIISEGPLERKKRKTVKQAERHRNGAAPSTLTSQLL